MYTGIWITRSLYQSKLKNKYCRKKRLPRLGCSYHSAGFGFSISPLIIEYEGTSTFALRVLPWWRRCGRGDAWRAWPSVWCVHTVGCLWERWPPCTGRCQRAQPEGWGGAHLSSLWTYLMGKKGVKGEVYKLCYCFWDTHEQESANSGENYSFNEGTALMTNILSMFIWNIFTVQVALIETLFGLIQKVLFLNPTAFQSNKDSTVTMSHYGCILDVYWSNWIKLILETTLGTLP